MKEEKIYKVYKDKEPIATTDPWMMKFLKNKEDGYKYSHGSTKKVEVICPYCGVEKEMIISNLYKRKSVGCSCGDGISKSEKIIMSLLNQLDVKYIKEYNPVWIGDKRRYDFYLIDYNIIIEANGSQHYIQTNREGARTLQEEQENDKYKKQLALDNGIKTYIELDCRESNIDFIKNSIMNSKLSELFDLSKIDWLKCAEFAVGNLLKDICDYWNNKNENETTIDIANKFNVGRNLVNIALHKGNEHGWCSYDGRKEMIKSNTQWTAETSNCSKRVKVFKDGVYINTFNSIMDLDRLSEKELGVKLDFRNISAVLNGKRNHHKGYTFEYEQPNQGHSNKKTTYVYDKDYNLLYTFDTMRECCRYLLDEGIVTTKAKNPVVIINNYIYASMKKNRPYKNMIFSYEPLQTNQAS